MKKITAILLLYLVGACAEPVIYKEYKAIYGDWKLLQTTPSDNLLKTINFSCKPSKKLVKNENHACVGFINSKEDLEITYRISSNNTIEILGVNKHLDYNTVTPEITALRNLLKTQWKYQMEENRMRWEDSSGRVLVFEKD